jgi:hypothetical protein
MRFAATEAPRADAYLSHQIAGLAASHTQRDATDRHHERRPLRLAQEPDGRIRPMKRLPLVVALGLVVLALAVPMSGGMFGLGSASSSPAGPSPAARATIGPSSAPAGAGSPAAGPTATPTAAATPSPTGPVAIVSVTQFRAPWTATTAKEVGAVLAGASKRYAALELVGDEADAVLAAIGAGRPTGAAADRLVLAPDASTLTADLAKHRDRLAFLRASDVTPAVRALAWGDSALFGVGRVRTSADWPLVASLPARPGEADFDPAGTWTLFAGGDILLDRGVAQTVKVKGKGVDFPFDGGTADITSRYCCSSFGWDLPRIKRTGGAGAMRDLIEGADLAIANFENPAPDRFRYHTSGTIFSADPALIEGLANAGIDWVSLANNHIRDAGANGILQTIENLDDHGIRSGGAGKDLAAARKPAILEAKGTKVALLAYDTIAKSYAATASRVGSAQLTAKACREDIAAARKAGAGVVIVFPHWGTEYDPSPFKGQRTLAQACIDAGADMVIGNHAHWAGALEVHDGKPIWYALGNFVFDQTWSEPTMEGVTLELTFAGPKLVQAVMRPHIILDKAQPNFLDPNGDGKVVLGQVFAASKGLLPW